MVSPSVVLLHLLANWWERGGNSLFDRVDVPLCGVGGFGLVAGYR